MFVFKYNELKKVTTAFVFLAMLFQGNAQAQQAASSVKNEGKSVVTGTVLDASTKKGLVGIRVSVTDFSAAITDENGAFSINVPSLEEEVIISGEGFETKVIPLKGRNTLSVSLLDDSHHSFQEETTLPLDKKMRAIAIRWGQGAPLKGV